PPGHTPETPASTGKSADAAADPATDTRTATAGRKDILASVLRRAGMKAADIYALAHADRHKRLTRFVPGERFEVRYQDDQPVEVIRHINRTTQIVATRDGKRWQIRKKTLPVEIHLATASGTIRNSLYLSGKQAGLSDKVIMNLANLYQWEIDFARQLRPGDTFKVIYEQRYLNGDHIGDGRIVAAEVNTSGKTYRAFLLTDKKGRTLGWYDEKGHNLRKAFMRNPVDYVRITSRFTLKRWHPIQHRWKAHRGVDYGGRTGTPIHVTGNGRVIFKGWKRGYGRVVMVKHGRKYTTVYAHMSRFGKIRKGSYVKQGQVIGYIGQSGWATGPHLHYEFRINGRHVDPLKVRFPDASPVPKKYRTVFRQRVHQMMAHLKRLDSDTRLAAKFE
uniref:M23 family metallopeptidase n=1 Tax=Sulfurivirga sp. TaxID=2614236 RepID=UPI0025F80106